MKPVGYSSPEYQEKLSVVNRILGSCDLNAKERDLMIARGQQSESIYVFFTSMHKNICRFYLSSNISVLWPDCCSEVHWEKGNLNWLVQKFQSLAVCLCTVFQGTIEINWTPRKAWKTRTCPSPKEKAVRFRLACSLGKIQKTSALRGPLYSVLWTY